MSSTELLSVGQAAAIAGMHPNTIRRWTERGELPCVPASPSGGSCCGKCS